MIVSFVFQDDIDRQRQREPLLSETESAPEEPKIKETAVKFGWIKGVLVRKTTYIFSCVTMCLFDRIIEDLFGVLEQTSIELYLAFRQALFSWYMYIM